MPVTRRHFLKLTAAAAATTAFGGLGLGCAAKQKTAAAATLPTDRIKALKPEWSKQTTSICCYCGVGCGLIVNTSLATNRAINTEGDPDHPINEGALCAKGSALWQLGENDKRPKTVLYRAPYSDKFEEKPWDWAIKRIARLVKDTRDKGFETKNAKGEVVNRVNNLASVGSAALDNEECWAYQSMLRTLGLVFIEHQARICHSSTVPALAESFGRGAMTNHYNDIANSDCVLIMGSNAAETHPISFKWVTRAQERGGTLIHVDPRFTRTSAKADHHFRLRSGTDIAVLGGMINYILAHDLIFKNYVVNYTNAAFIVGEKFGFSDGLFSGFDAQKRAYDKSNWAFEMDAAGVPKKDPSLKNPRCVYQLLKKHYSRYSLKNVSTISGMPQEDLAKLYKLYAATGKPDKAGTIMYAMGWTQHTVGVQNIRTMAMIQLLLGNIGVAGGGVNALRGESNVQGSTDHGLLFHILPGYLPTPMASLPTLAAYNEKNTPVSKDPKSANWWQHRPKYVASLLKSMWENAELEQAYSWMPKLDPGGSNEYSWLALFDKMSKGQFKGFFAWGMNPACSSANANKTRNAMATLDWMVNVNIFENETGWFWQGPGMDPKTVKTEVFFLPCAVSFEKEGSITNSGRWMQWRYAGPKPYAGTKPDGEIISLLFKEIQALYKKEKGALPEPILAATWNKTDKHGEFDPHAMAKLVNGTFLKDVKIGDKVYKKGDQVPAFAQLQADGSTTSGNWVYCGSYTDKNKATQRDLKQTPEQAAIGLFPNWTWAWPVNRRILYNRASCDPTGKPWNPAKAVVAWNAADKKWIGDVPDGPWAPEEKHPFIMTTHGFGQIYGPGLNDGPFPEYYEPLECPVTKHPFSKQLHNPTALAFEGEEKAVCDPRFPFVCSTYRVTEHWQTGLMTRWQPWLIEAEPQIFCEISPELAKYRGIANGDKVIVSSVRGSTWAVAIVTPRVKPFKVQGQILHQVGMPWHYGWIHPKDGGDSANLLSPSVGDPNTGIPETKAFMVNVRKA